MGWFEKSNRQTEHEYVEERLSPYLDGQLLPEERTVVDRHLASCQECQWNLETLRQTVQWMKELPDVPVPRMFTIPVPAEPVHTPRWRWSVPVLQAATALVAVLLFFAMAGDFMLTNLAPAREPQNTAMWEREAVDVQMVELTVEVEAVPAGAEAPQAAKAVEEAPVAPAPATVLPTPTLQEASPAEPARIAAEIVSTPTAESSTMGGLGLSPPPEEEKEAVAETDAAKPPPTEESVGVAATETVAANDEVEALPTPMPATAPTVTTISPTAVAVAPEPALGAREGESLESTVTGEEALGEEETVGALQQPLVFWLGAAKVSLAVVFVLLLTTTVVVMLQRRRAR